ncbi:MAG: enoyl-CoA hydratase/isomerase family protein [Planctomycetota bacterium]
MIEEERVGDVVVLRFAHGKASALDTEFLVELERRMRAFEEGDGRACILTGTGRIFSAGVDLKRLLDGGDEYLAEFLPALERAFTALFFSEKPVVGACNGHAIAGGCVILSCCDHRIGARGRGRIGVPELTVGVPFPPLALEIIRFATPSSHLQDTLYEGATFDMEQALARGLVDELSLPDELDDHAFAAAHRLARYPSGSFGFTKRLVRRPIADALAPHAERDRAEIRALWGSAPVQDAIREYVERTLG